MSKINFTLRFGQQNKFIYSLTAFIIIAIAGINYYVNLPTENTSNILSSYYRPDDFITQEDRQNTFDIIVQKGDTLGRILHRIGISQNEIHEISKELKKKNSLRIGVGQEIHVQLAPSFKEIESIQIMVNYEKTIAIKKIGENFEAKEIYIPLNKKFVRASGEINGSLISAAIKQGVPHKIIDKVVKLLSYEIDFQRDIKMGDKFDIIFENFYHSDKSVKTGSIMYAAIHTKGKNIKLYGYNAKNDEVDFFTEKGQSIKRDLLRTPLNVAKISSKFGMRKHPTLGYTKMHKGVDFAAPIGTAIYAAGDGVIEEIGYKGAYGNYIRLKHKSGISTAYAHMSKFGNNLKKGVRVKQGQIIGNVGTTGRSTGAHLHFEVLIAGKHINPVSVKSTPGRKLHGRELREFEAYISKINKIMNNADASCEINPDIFKFAAR